MYIYIHNPNPKYMYIYRSTKPPPFTTIHEIWGLENVDPNLLSLYICIYKPDSKSMYVYKTSAPSSTLSLQVNSKTTPTTTSATSI
ncbi:hypothetical protein LguiA_025846 [Lonicera macranthoides]